MKKAMVIGIGGIGGLVSVPLVKTYGTDIALVEISSRHEEICAMASRFTAMPMAR